MPTCLHCSSPFTKPRNKKAIFCSHRCYTQSRIGSKVSPEVRKKIALAKLGENNPNWKGDAVQYTQLHAWVKRQIEKPKLCKCGQRPAIDLACVTGIYSRDLKNWEYLCRRCHMMSDGRMSNLFRQWSDSGTAKLTEGQVLSIRRMHKSGMSCAMLARIYSLSASHVSHIVKGRKWKGLS